MSILKTLKIIFKCLIFGHHSWTSRSIKGIISTKDEIKEYGIEYCFKRDSLMYCDDCKRESKLNKW